jgi:spermidine/putrescine transport system substrate-binding protein
MTTTARLSGASALALALAAGAAMAQDRDLLVFDYSGFENPEFHSRYIAQHGSSPTFTFFGDEEEAFQKVRSGFRTDITHICGGSVPKWTDSGLLAPWDRARIEAYGTLNANLLGTEVSAGREELYFLPTDWGTTAILYNAETVPAEDVASLNVFLNPAYAQRITIPDNVDDAYALAYLATGVTNWTTATEEQFQAASDWLRQVHPNLRTYWTDPAELAALHATGEILVSWAWNESLPTLVDEGHSVAFQRQPAEGSSVWLCGLVKMQDAPGSEDKAYDYVNAFLDPSSTAALVDSGYGHSNAAAMTQFSAEDLAAVGMGEIAAPILAQLPMDGALRERQTAEFQRIKAGF